MNELRLVIPLLPPSAGHYNNYRCVIPRNGGKPFVQVYPTAEAEAWWACVSMVNAGRHISGPSLEGQIIVFLPDRQRRDADNFLKCSLDALTKCKAIEDDSLFADLHVHKRIDATNPRTVIIVKSDQGQLL